VAETQIVTRQWRAGVEHDPSAQITHRTIATSIHPSAVWRRLNNQHEAEIPNVNLEPKIVDWTRPIRFQANSSPLLVVKASQRAASVDPVS
jgi:hypothetical protein